MPCDMCGYEGPTTEAIVEGSILHVCSKCSTYGNVIAVEKKDFIPERPRKITIEEPVQLLVDDYGERIKHAREKKVLKQADLGVRIGEKESTINKYEKGIIKPSLSTALRLQRELDIALIENYETQNQIHLKVSDKNITIGDLLKFKKKE